MPQTSVPGVRSTKPLDLATPDWGSPFLRGIQRLVLFDSPTPKDLIYGTQLTRVGTAITSAPTPAGYSGMANTAESSYWTLPSFPGDLTRSLSMLWVGLHSGGTAPQTIRDNSSSGGNILFWRNAGQWDQRIGGTDYTAAGTFNTNQLYAAVLSSSSTAVKTWVDGRLVIDGGVAASFGVTSPWYINQAGPNLVGPLATTVLLAIWNRPLTDQEAQDLTLNPWRLFADQITVIQSAAAAGNTIQVPAASLTLTGFAPTVAATANQRIEVPAGSLSLTAIAPSVTVSSANTIQVPSGSLNLTAFAPVVVSPKTITVPAGSLSLTGFAPTVTISADRTIQVPAGALTLTGIAPSVVTTASNLISVPAGAVVLTGYAPLVSNGEVAQPVVYGGGFKRKKRKYDHLDPDSVRGSIKQEEEPPPAVEKPKQKAKAKKPDKGGALTDVKPVTLPPQEEPKAPEATEAPEAKEPTIQEIVEQALRKISAEVIGQLESYRKAEDEKQKASAQQRSDEELQRSAMKAQQEAMKSEEDDVLTLVASIEQEPRQVLLKAYERAMKLMKSGL